jgi:hypothetical protein
MAEVQTSEVDAKPAYVIFGLSVAKFGNHGNQTIVSQYKPLCNSGSLSWTCYLTTVTMVGDITVETKVCSLL